LNVTQTQTKADLLCNPGPYAAYQIQRGSQEGRWDVMGAAGISTGYIGLKSSSCLGAMAEAGRLNTIWDGE
jgi:threonine/homoserine/homoserine lactone efflux protein